MKGSRCDGAIEYPQIGAEPMAPRKEQPRAALDASGGVSLGRALHQQGAGWTEGPPHGLLPEVGWGPSPPAIRVDGAVRCRRSWPIVDLAGRRFVPGGRRRGMRSAYLANSA